MPRHACINHEKIQSVTMCYQCHKPICRACVVVMPQGEFCSTECNAIFKTMKEQLAAAEKAKPSKIVVAVGAFLIVIGLTVAYHLVVVNLDEGSKSRKTLERFDIWGMLLSAPEKVKERQRK